MTKANLSTPKSMISLDPPCDEKGYSTIQKQVRFESEHRNKHIPSVWTQNEIASRWYQRKTLKQFHAEYERKSREIDRSSYRSKNRSLDADLEGFQCPTMSAHATVDWHQRRIATISAILREQHRQKALDVSSSMYIPMISKRLSKKDRAAAQVVGLRNEEFVREEGSMVSEDSPNLQEISRIHTKSSKPKCPSNMHNRETPKRRSRQSKRIMPIVTH